MRESQMLVDDDDDFDAEAVVLTPRDSRPAESPFKKSSDIKDIYPNDHSDNNHSGIVLEVRKSINAYQENDHFSKTRLQETPPRRLETNRMGQGDSQSTNQKAVQTR